MMIVFIVLSVVMVGISLYERGGEDNPKAIRVEKSLFETGMVFNVSAIIICAIIAILYALFW